MVSVPSFAERPIAAAIGLNGGSMLSVCLKGEFDERNRARDNRASSGRFILHIQIRTDYIVGMEDESLAVPPIHIDDLMTSLARSKDQAARDEGRSGGDILAEARAMLSGNNNLKPKPLEKLTISTNNA
ncbi:hypothetical protein [Acidocella aquatica]|nr:hypothetical protein [Acidocella aquatica]